MQTRRLASARGADPRQAPAERKLRRRRSQGGGVPPTRGSGPAAADRRAPGLPSAGVVGDLPPLDAFGTLIFQVVGQQLRSARPGRSSALQQRFGGDEIETVLTEVPGIGPWTAHGFLIVALTVPTSCSPATSRCGAGATCLRLHPLANRRRDGPVGGEMAAFAASRSATCSRRSRTERGSSLAGLAQQLGDVEPEVVPSRLTGDDPWTC